MRMTVTRVGILINALLSLKDSLTNSLPNYSGRVAEVVEDNIEEIEEILIILRSEQEKLLDNVK